MAFKELGQGGSVLKWTPGTVVEGVWLGIKPGKSFQGKVSTLGQVKRKDGTVVVFPLGAAIEYTISDNGVQIGELVRITAGDLTPNKSGTGQYRAFKTEIDRGEAGIAPAASFDRGTPVKPASDMAAEIGKMFTPKSGLDEYGQLVERLTAKLGAASTTPMLSALLQIFPDDAARLAQLKAAVAMHGA